MGAGMRRASGPRFEAFESQNLLGTRIPLISLRLMLAVAHYRSFRQAANVLGISPSSVSERIKALESDLGVLLFDRNTRGEPPLVCRQLYSGWLSFAEVGSVRDHAVEHAEQLPCRRGQSGFHRFSCLLQLLPERSERRRVTGRMQGGEIEGGPDGCSSATYDPSSVALAAIPGNRRKAGESGDLSAIGCADLRQRAHRRQIALHPLANRLALAAQPVV